MSEDEQPPAPLVPEHPAPWERPWAVAGPPERPEARANTATGKAGDELGPLAAISTDAALPWPTRLQNKRAHRRRRAARLRRTAAVAIAALTLFVTGAAWGLSQYFDAKLHKVAALDEDSSSVHDAASQRGDENYLLVGSDSRAGANGGVGAGTTEQAVGARSDTVMLAHVPADRGRVVVVSFPRDLEIDRPACAEWHNDTATYGTQTALPETQVKLNTAYFYGGPKCLVQVIQRLSGLKINHFVGVDFAGFEALVNQIGGVEVCTTRPLVDNELGTILPDTGRQVIDGKTALDYVRARKVDAEGSGDYGRITRQQRFLSSLLRKAMSTDVLFNFGKLTGFIRGFTAATFGENMGTDSLVTLGQSLQGLSAGRVTFLTVPTTGTRDGNEVPDPTGISKIFQAIIDGTPLPGEQGAPPPTTPPPAPPPKPGGNARITVLNASTIAGIATTTATRLGKLGYTTGDVDSADETQPTTTIRYSPPQSAAATELASSVPGAQLQEATGLGDTIELVLGTAFTGEVNPPSVGTANPDGPRLPTDLSVVNAGDASCG